ncbi:MAG: molybdopterin converting factor subunit 1 [Pikeienuella sp.]
MIRVMYFAWLRERIDESAEDFDASGLATVAELVAALKAKGERYEVAFADMASIRIAVDQRVASLDAPLAGVREVAFFPPMTGG